MIVAMSHISKKDIDNKIKQQLQKNLVDLLKNTGSGTRVHIFEELFTETERTMLAKRIGIILLLKKGLSPYKISQLLGVSPSTAERFNNMKELGKYEYTTKWVWQRSKEGSMEKILESLVSLAFTRHTKSFKKFMDEY